MDRAGLKLPVTCGVLASAARLVPVPLLDDFLRETAWQVMVSRTLRAHARTYRSKLVAPLYGDSEGCLHGCLMLVLLLPLKLLVYPIRKIVAWVMAAKWLAKDLSEAVLLVRVLDELLGEGRLADDTDAGALRAEAGRVRRAFDNAVRGTDMRVLRGVLRKALRSVAGLPRAAFRALRSMRRKAADDTDPMAGLSDSDRAKVEEGADSVQHALSTPEMQAFLGAFDVRFRDNLRVLEQRERVES